MSSLTLRLRPSRKRRSLSLAALVVVIGVTVMAVVAQAAHWPFYGGDQGRSGNQPLDPGVLPINRVHERTGALEDNVQNSIITTAGSVSARLYAFGVEDPGNAAETGGQAGQVHIHDLESGDHPGDAAAVDVDDGADDADTFRGLNTEGTGNDFRRLEGQGVAFADPTPPGQAPTQLFVVHNDDNQDGTNDISIALVDIASGLERGEQAVPGTDRFTIASSPVFGPQRATSPPERDLFFVARSRAEDPTRGECAPPADPCEAAMTRLFKITITNPASPSATGAGVTSVVVPAGNPLASPSLANLTTTEGSGDAATRSTELYVVQGGNGGNVYTFEADSLAPGPAVDLASDGDAQTVSVPVNSDGSTPASAQALFVAVGESAFGVPERVPNQSTRVYRLQVVANPNGVDTLAPATTGDPAQPTGTSNQLAGSPAAALAVDVRADDPEAGGNVVVTTSRNLFVLEANDLRNGDRLTFSDDRSPGGNGFSRNTAAVSGGLGFVSQDDGRPLTIGLGDAQPVADDQFNEFESHLSSTFSLGQPSISARFVQFGSSNGAFVYRASLPRPVGEQPPPPVGVAVTDASINEGDSGTRQLTFTVSLSGASTRPVTVDYDTADDTATAGSDYTAASGTVTFAAGETSKSVNVDIIGDTVDEDAERFFVNLSNPSGGARLTDAQGVGAIIDDDEPTPPAEQAPARTTVVVGDTGIAEGDSGRRNAVFTLALSQAASGPSTVAFATVNGTAVAGEDYVATAGTVTFARGETTKTVSVPVNGDVRFEPDETFELRLSRPSGIDIARGTGTGTIANDEDAPIVRKKPGVVATVTPRRDATFPYRFRAVGRVVLPTGVTRAQGCGAGVVSVQYKVGKKTISTRRTTLKRDCRFTIRTTFSLPKRLQGGRLKVTIRFAGNKFLLRGDAKTRFVRAG